MPELDHGPTGIQYILNVGELLAICADDTLSTRERKNPFCLHRQAKDARSDQVHLKAKALGISHVDSLPLVLSA